MRWLRTPSLGSQFGLLMSVLNWIVSQFDYLFFIQGVPATPTVTAKTTTTTTKTFIGNGTTEMIYYKEYFAVHTGVLPTMTIRIKLTLRNKGFFFYWTGKGPFFALVSLNEFAKPVLWVHCLVQHHNQWSTYSSP